MKEADIDEEQSEGGETVAPRSSVASLISMIHNPNDSFSYEADAEVKDKFDDLRKRAQKLKK